MLALLRIVQVHTSERAVTLCRATTKIASRSGARPNPSVNADAPVHGGNSAGRGGGAPVTLIR